MRALATGAAFAASHIALCRRLVQGALFARLALAASDWIERWQGRQRALFVEAIEEGSYPCIADRREHRILRAQFGTVEHTVRSASAGFIINVHRVMPDFRRCRN